MKYLYLLVLMLLAAACGSQRDAGSQSYDGPERPNVLILFTDDQRFNTLAALGNEEIRTPNMDRLVENGLTFTHAHTMGGLHGAICAPSRASLMTGRPLFHLRGNGDFIPQSHIMIPEALRAAGYATFATGKWHHPRNAFARAFSEQADNIFFGGMHMPDVGGHEQPQLYHFDPEGKYPREASFQRDQFSSSQYADAAIEFLNSYGQQERPFFAYVSFTSPHDPRTPPEPYASWYDPDSISLPPNFLPEHPFDNGEMDVRDENLTPRPRTAQRMREELAAYYGMISEVDAQIGRILEALDANGQTDNTLIVFAGDNGLAVGSHGLLGKQNLYEHSVRIPLVFSGPGIPSGEQRDAFVYLSDLFPTFCDLLGIERPSSVLGTSLAPLVQDAQAEKRSSVYYAYRYLQRGVRSQDNWKLLEYHVKGERHSQLFNLNEDPSEQQNLAEDPAYAGKLASMRELLKAEVKAYNDPVDLDSPTWGKGAEEKPKEISHLGVGAKVTLGQEFSFKYPGQGPQGLTDGITCTSNFREDCWHALEGQDLEAVIDLGEAKSIQKISTQHLRDIGSWIFLPRSVTYEVSMDGVSYQPAGTRNNPDPTDLDGKGIIEMPVEFKPRLARYIRLKVRSQGSCPEWHAGAGGKAWLFVDEVVVE